MSDQRPASVARSQGGGAGSPRRRPGPAVYGVGFLLSAAIHVILLAAVAVPRPGPPWTEGTRWAFHPLERPPEIEVPPPPEPVRRPDIPRVAAVEVGEPAEVSVPAVSDAPATEPPDPPPVSPAPIADRPPGTQPHVPPVMTEAREFRDRLRRRMARHLERGRRGGVVELRFFVDADGAVSRIEVTESSGHRGLARLAHRMAEDLEFHPALDRDRTVGVWVTQRICFVKVDRPGESIPPAECERRVAAGR